MRERHSLAEQIVEFVEANWKQGISVKEIAGHFSVSASEAERSFRKLKRMPIKKYIQGRRKEFILDAVRNSAPSGYEVGFELGFQEEQSFYRCVKKSFGMTWTELCGLHRDGVQDPRRGRRSQG
jgi:methylphosphotriester-DNA--protein-cysteine methyltransferase